MRKTINKSDHVDAYLKDTLRSLLELRDKMNTLSCIERKRAVIQQRATLNSLKKVFNGEAFFIGVPGRKE